MLGKEISFELDAAGYESMLVMSLAKETRSMVVSCVVILFCCWRLIMLFDLGFYLERCLA